MATVNAHSAVYAPPKDSSARTSAPLRKRRRCTGRRMSGTYGTRQDPAPRLGGAEPGRDVLVEPVGARLRQAGDVRRLRGEVVTPLPPADRDHEAGWRLRPQRGDVLGGDVL